MENKETVVRPVQDADDGYYITPDGVLLRVVPSRVGWGYRWARVRQHGKQRARFIHRMVAAAYVPNPRQVPQVNHKNGDKFDNRAENLEWVTPQENTRHAHALGLAGKRATAVDMFSLDGRYLQSFESLKDAAAFLGRPDVNGVSRAIHGKQKTAYGFIWKSQQETTP